MFSLRSQNLIKVLQEIMDIKQKTFVKDFWTETEGVCCLWNYMLKKINQTTVPML